MFSALGRQIGRANRPPFAPSLQPAAAEDLEGQAHGRGSRHLVAEWPMPWLFSYGTLQESHVQQALFGRTFTSRPDALPHFVRGRVPVVPDDRLNAGLTHYENAVFSGHASDRIEGTVLDLSDAELQQADIYEAPAAYERVEATLASGLRAWVYLRHPRDEGPSR
jgi:hypothetical protein